MLMDLFHSCVVTPRKKRVHFNTFMLDIHKSRYHASNCDWFILICPLYFLFFILSRPAPRNYLPLCVQVKLLLYSIAFGPGFVDAGVL